jgi:anti-sigma factor RsiW
MSCSPFDLRDYFLKELPAPERQQVDLHLKTCPACREEVDRLRLTEAALASLRDEEIPRRLAFVSDRIFEPSPWARFWSSGARLGFASAAMLSVALVVYSVSGAGQKPGTSHALNPEVQQQIQAAVDRAVEQRVEKLARFTDAALDYSRREELMYQRSSYGGR